MREAIEQPIDRRVRLQAREMHSDADVRSLGEGELVAHVLPADVEAIRVGEGRGVAVGTGDRDGDELALADRGPAEPDDAGRVPIDCRGRRLEPQRLLDGVGEQPAVGLDERTLVGMGEEVEDRVADHPLGRLDPAEHEDADVRGDLGAGETPRLARGGGDQR